MIELGDALPIEKGMQAQEGEGEVIDQVEISLEDLVEDKYICLCIILKG